MTFDGRQPMMKVVVVVVNGDVNVVVVAAAVDPKNQPLKFG